LTRPSSTAELGVDFFKHGQHLRLIGHVGLHRDGLAAGLADLPHHFVGGQRVAGVVDGHRPALAGRKQGRGRAYAARAAGDQNNF
jgi:hypothetical protein